MKKIIYFTLVLFTLVATSCLNVVEFDPTDRYSQSLGFKNPTNVNLYLNSFYPIIYQYGQYGSRSLGGNGSMSDGLTDILKFSAIVAGAGDPNLIMTVDNYTNVNANHFDTWSGGYTWIRRINEFLDGLEKNSATFTEAQYKQFKAEALFFRGYVYSLIMRAHASSKDDLGVIIYSNIDQMTIKNKNTPRSGVAASYDFIASDIDFALNNLPLPSTAKGRLNKYAAAALKARIMLYAGRYSEAKSAALLVKNATNYGYLEDYSSIFKTVDNKEVVYGFDFKFQVLVHDFDRFFSPAADIISSGGYAGPTQEFVDMFDNADGTPYVVNASTRFITDQNVDSRDPRLGASVLYNQATWRGRKLACYEGGRDQDDMPYGAKNAPGNTVTGYYMKKLLDESNLAFVANGSTQPWNEFRYAEVMLILAECYAKEGNYTDAWNLINDLRKVRFHRTDVVTPTFSTWSTALDVILKERAIELCYEGHRFWDLRRTGRAIQTLNAKTYNGVLWKTTDNGATFTPTLVSCELGLRRYPERFNQFPIPQTEIMNNTKAIQNSGW